MRFQLALAFALLAAPARAQAPDSIETFLAGLNRALQGPDSASLSALLAPDADYRFGARRVAAGPADIAEALREPPFSELSAPRISNITVRLLSPDIALVDGRQVRYGSQIPRQSLPVLLVLQRTAGHWRILSWRIPVTTFLPYLMNDLPAAPQRRLIP